MMVPEISNQKVKISSILKICDKSDIRLALVALVSAVKIKQSYFYAMLSEFYDLIYKSSLMDFPGFGNRSLAGDN